MLILTAVPPELWVAHPPDCEHTVVGGEYAFTAERPAGGDCATVELRVRTGITFAK